MHSLQVNYSNLENNKPISVILKGHLTSLSAIEFKKNLLAEMSKKATDCYVDISQVEKMDVTGVNALAMAHKTALRSGSKLFIQNRAGSQVEEFLYLSKLMNYINYIKTTT